MKRIKIMLVLSLMILQTGFVSQYPKVKSADIPVCDPIPHNCGECAWPEYRHDNFNTGFTQSECAPPCDDVREIWHVILRPDEHIINPPIVDCGYVFVGTTAGTFYALNADTGAVVWFRFGLGAITTSACVYDHKVYIGTDSGFVYCFDVDNGNSINSWPVSVFSAVSTSVKIFENRLFVGTQSGQFWCFKPNGSSAWSAPLITGGEISGAPAIGYGYVWFGSADGWLYCADISTGKMKPGWPVQTGYSIGTLPAIGKDIIYYKSSILNVLDSLSGWPVNKSVITPNVTTNPAVDTNIACECDSFVYAGNQEDKIWKTTKQSSWRVWSRLLGKIDGIDSTPSITENRVYLTANGRIYVIDAKTGTILHMGNVNLYHINEQLTSIAIAYERLYFASTSCTIYSYGCCKPREIIPAYIILKPAQAIAVCRSCSQQFEAHVYTLGGTPIPELDSLIEYYCNPSDVATINVKTGLFKAGNKISPPIVGVTAVLRTSYLTNLGNTIDVNIVSPPTMVNIINCP